MGFNDLQKAFSTRFGLAINPAGGLSLGPAAGINLDDVETFLALIPGSLDILKGQSTTLPADNLPVTSLKLPLDNLTVDSLTLLPATGEDPFQLSIKLLLDWENPPAPATQAVDGTPMGFSLEGISVTIETDGSELSVTLEAVMDFEGLKLDVVAQLPACIFEASLKSNVDAAAGRKLLTNYIPKGSASGPTLNGLELMVALRPPSLLIHCSVENLFTLDPFTLEGMEVEMTYSTGKVSGRLWADFEIAIDGQAPLVLDLLAEYDPDADWKFGAQAGGAGVKLGVLLKALEKLFQAGTLSLPPVLANLDIAELSLACDTEAKLFTFSIEVQFEVEDTAVDVTVTVNLKSGDSSSTTVDAVMHIGPYEFELHLDSGASTALVATYKPATLQQQNIHDLIEPLSHDVAHYIPDSLEIELKDVLFAFSKTTDDKETTRTTFLFALDIGTNISLSNLPLVGQEFTSDKTVSVDDLRLLVASKDLIQDDVKALNALMPTGVTKLPAVVIPEGLTVSATMNFAGSTKILSMPVASRAPTSATPAKTALAPVGTRAADAAATTTATPSSSSSDNTKWFNLQKTLGPVYFDKVGVQYQDATLSFLLNAALTAAGLTISLDGLSVGSPLDHFSPEFKLHGVGIDYDGGAVEIGAAFLRTQGVAEDGTKYDEYDGTAVIKTEEFTLSALGSYTKLDGHPSLFIYAFLDYPLGGPAFFFVTGLAVGFGYNRKLIVPPIDQVADFPLVKQAVGGQASPGGLAGTLQDLQHCIPPAVGEIFLAVGIKFNSFKLIDSFALLTVEFGGPFVANILGLSTAIIPTPEEGKSVTPLAEVQIAWKATFDPAEGFLGVNAQLTSNSYILSKDCHLTGGYAFYSWFSGEHAGDFVQTLGGYHPSFAVPAHYPVVPRLAFLWQVSSEVTIKGDAYYALTGSNLMAGGHLEVTFESGDLKAWLKLGADFLISWKPYHYDASVYVDVGVSYTFDINLLFAHIRTTISVDVGADLHLWGPDFSGTADIHLWIISFTISFGAGASQTPEAIYWPTFQTSFLPAADKVCSISVKDGLVRTMEGKTQKDGLERWIINPKHFSLVLDSAVPFKEAYQGNQEVSETDGKVTIKDLSPPVKIMLGGAETSFGIGSMEVSPADLHSTITITPTRNGVLADDLFTCTPVRKRIPAGLWGESLTPDINGNTFIEYVPTGFEITPSAQPAPGETAIIDLSKFQYSSSYFPKDQDFPDEGCIAFAWVRASSFSFSPGLEGKEVEKLKDGPAKDAQLKALDVARRNAVNGSIKNNSSRDALKEALKVIAAVNFNGDIANDFLSAPKIGTFAS